MKQLLTLLSLLIIVLEVNAQRIPQVPDSVRKRYQVNYPRTTTTTTTALDYTNASQDSLIKIRLVQLALKNPAMNIAQANVSIADAQLRYAKSSWLSSVNAGANINEFVINNSPAANFFPKYNLGIAIPFDIVTRMKKDKKVAQANQMLTNENVKSSELELKAIVLTAYENYKEKNETVILQKRYMEYDYSTYQAAQKAYADGDATLEQMNKTHQIYLTEVSKLVIRERELNVAIIQLEQIVAVPIAEAFRM